MEDGSIVLLLPRDYTSDTTFGIINIACSPWDQMNVDMKHRLSSRRAYIDPDVEALDASVFCDKDFAAYLYELIDSVSL